jgi:ATP-dependent Clp protease ATP-binding subunit ClpA
VLLHAELGVTAEAVERELAAKRLPGRLGPAEAQALELGLREAIALRHKEIGSEHLLLGLTRAADEPAAGVLRALQAPPEAVRATVLAKLRKAS